MNQHQRPVFDRRDRDGFASRGAPAPLPPPAPAAQQTDGGEFWEVVAFLDPAREGGKKRIRSLGWAKQRENGEWQIKLETIPVAAWDGSLVLRPRRDRQDGGDR